MTLYNVVGRHAVHGAAPGEQVELPDVATTAALVVGGHIVPADGETVEVPKETQPAEVGRVVSVDDAESDDLMVVSDGAVVDATEAQTSASENGAEAVQPRRNRKV